MSLTLRSLSDDDLTDAIASLAIAERTATASLIAHLAELEDRSLHLAQGFRSLFAERQDSFREEPGITRCGTWDLSTAGVRPPHIIPPWHASSAAV